MSQRLLKRNTQTKSDFQKYQIIRNEIFPRDEKIFSTYFCIALAKDKKTLPAQEIIILTNNPMLKQLSSSLQWYIDATFQIEPKEVRQILI